MNDVPDEMFINEDQTMTTFLSRLIEEGEAELLAKVEEDAATRAIAKQKEFDRRSKDWMELRSVMIETLGVLVDYYSDLPPNEFLGKESAYPVRFTPFSSVTLVAAFTWYEPVTDWVMTGVEVILPHRYIGGILMVPRNPRIWVDSLAAAVATAARFEGVKP